MSYKSTIDTPPYSKERILEIFLEFSRDFSRLMKAPSKNQLALAHHVINKVFVPDCKLIDLGGGLNPLNGVIARLGGSVTVIDIFEYDLAWQVGKTSNEFAADCAEKKRYLESVGVKFVDSDICKLDLRDMFPATSIDAITSHHCLEHLHQSPKAVLESALDVLKPGGRMMLEVPNAINLLKRIKVLAGQTNYGSYEQYYDASNYTGHIREYSVSDLKTLARKLELSSFRIYGKNWYGTLYNKLGENHLSTFFDWNLQRFPNLCGSLFLEYQKPA